MPPHATPWFIWVLSLLRLSVTLNRGREPEQVPKVKLSAKRNGEQQLKLRFPDDFLATHPMSLADLEYETQALATLGMTLRIEDESAQD